MAQSVDCRCSRRSFMVYTRGIVWPGLLVLASCGGSSGSGDSQSLGASRTGAASAPEGFCNGLDPATSHPRFSTYEPDAIAVGAEDVPQLADGTYVLTDIQYAADCAGLGNTRTTNAILSIADAGAYNETGAGATLEISWIDSARVERRATYSVSEQYGDLFGPSANLALNHICGSFRSPGLKPQIATYTKTEVMHDDVYTADNADAPEYNDALAYTLAGGVLTVYYGAFPRPNSGAYNCGAWIGTFEKK